MSKPVQGVQPAVLRWARETSGMSVQDVAEKLKRAASEIQSWEAGESAPSYPQLETLAYKVYRRPIALFFFPSPPDEQNPNTEFRSLPASELEELSPDTLRHIRLAKAYQIALMELHDGKNPIQEPIFEMLRLTEDSPIQSSATRIRRLLSVELEVQVSTRSDSDALKMWRRAVEDTGIHVFKDSMKQKRVSGFSLHHPAFPVIFVNNSTSKTRQIFTILHELVHLLLGFNGMTTLSQIAFGGYSRSQKKIETFCNRVAAEILVPDSAFEMDVESAADTDDSWLQGVARKYCVSKEVILRKLYDRGLITRDEYIQKATLWNKPLERNARKSGGDVYNSIGVYLSERYMQAVFSNQYRGRLTIDQVADYLGVKTRGVAEIESRVLGRAGNA